MGLQIEQSEQDGTAVITIEGEVDLNTSPGLRAALLKAAAKGKGKSSLAVDLRGVRYMDSSGVATLIEGLKSVREKGGRFVLLAPSNSVMKVLQLSRLDTVFEICETL